MNFGVMFQKDMLLLNCHVFLHYSPGAQFGRRTSADTGSSRISCPPVRGRQRCAAAAYWPEQTLGEKTEGKQQSNDWLKRFTQECMAN